MAGGEAAHAAGGGALAPEPAGGLVAKVTGGLLNLIRRDPAAAAPPPAPKKAGKPGKKAAAQPAAAVGYLVNGVKTCTECGTQRTPMWRNGPAGPKSLCNACGVRAGRLRNGQASRKQQQQRQAAATLAVAAGGVQKKRSHKKQQPAGGGGRGGGRAVREPSKRKPKPAAKVTASKAAAAAPKPKARAKPGPKPKVKPAAAKPKPAPKTAAVDPAPKAAAVKPAPVTVKPQAPQAPKAAPAPQPPAAPPVKRSHKKQPRPPAAGGDAPASPSGRARKRSRKGLAAADAQPEELRGETALRVLRLPSRQYEGLNLLTRDASAPGAPPLRCPQVTVTLTDDLPPNGQSAGLRVNVTHDGRLKTATVLRDAGPVCEGLFNKDTHRWEWNVTARWALEFTSKEALNRLRGEAVLQLQLLSAAHFKPPQAKATIAIPGVRQVQDPCEPSTSYAAKGPYKQRGPIGVLNPRGRPLYDADDADRAWLRQYKKGNFIEHHSAAEESRPAASGCENADPNTVAESNAPAPATPSLADAQRLASSSFPSGSSSETSGRPGPAVTDENMTDADAAAAPASPRAAPEPDRRLTLDQLERTVDAFEQVAALARKPFLTREEATKLMAECPWAPSPDGVLAVHCHWMNKLKANAFRPLVLHYQRNPPIGWREPRVTTHSFEFVVGPPKAPKRQSSQKKRKGIDLKKLAMDKEFLAMHNIDGQPIKHDHRAGVSCLACRLRSVARMTQRAGQAGLLLPKPVQAPKPALSAPQGAALPSPESSALCQAVLEQPTTPPTLEAAPAAVRGKRSPRPRPAGLAVAAGAKVPMAVDAAPAS